MSTSAAEARQLGYVRNVDQITMNRERLIADAKAIALDRVREGLSSGELKPTTSSLERLADEIL